MLYDGVDGGYGGRDGGFEIDSTSYEFDCGGWGNGGDGDYGGDCFRGIAVMDMEETIIFRIKSYCNRDGTTMLVVIMVVGGCWKKFIEKEFYNLLVEINENWNN